MCRSIVCLEAQSYSLNTQQGGFTHRSARQSHSLRLVGQEGGHNAVNHFTANSCWYSPSQKDGSQISVPCPQAIMSYNVYMGGVDRGDQLRGYYSCRTKSRKFYKCIFYFLLDTAITNVFVLYKHYAASPKHKTMQDFRVRLANELIGDYCSHRRAGRQGSLLKSPPIVTGNDVPDV